ncbi:MAG: T9SS type A sorting domain-containing protein [Flavobacteriaceae bacterium]|nr:T9SS type A sorting domain-containing protein [Flavobacteriaceae bacterium]
MKYIRLLLLLFSCSLFGQSDLTLNNDTYLFVTGDYYVKVVDDINLKAADSRIYLRDEAQMLQGNDIKNIGDGELSVYQDGTVNEYWYNFWCAPVGEHGGARGNNFFGITLFNDPTSLLNSTPVGVTHNANYNGIAGTPMNIEPNWIWTFITSDEYAEWIFNGATTTIEPGYGFTMKGTAGTSPTNPGSNQTYDFRGRPNTGTMFVPVIPPIATVPQWTLTGNPYPSALDAWELIWDADNINYFGVLPDPDPTDNLMTGVLNYWEQAGPLSHVLIDYRGGYATYTIDHLGTESTTLAPMDGYLADGTPVFAGGGNGFRVPQRYIPIGQGFMIEGLNPGNVQIKNDHRFYYRESGAQSFFFEANDQNQDIIPNRDLSDTSDEEATALNPDGTFVMSYNEQGYNIVPEGYKRFRLIVDFKDGLYNRHLLHNFNGHATFGFDYGMEAKSPEGILSDAWWVLDNDKYVIQAHPYDITLRIPLHMVLDEQQNVKFRMFDIQRFDEDQPIYLHDIENELYVDLRQQNYEINLEAGTYTDRFEITFLNLEALDLDDAIMSDFQIFQDNGQSQLTILNPLNHDVQKVQLFDVAGKLIFNSDQLETAAEYHFSTKTLSDGVYVAAVSIANQNPIHKKVIIKNN